MQTTKKTRPNTATDDVSNPRSVQLAQESVHCMPTINNSNHTCNHSRGTAFMQVVDALINTPLAIVICRIYNRMAWNLLIVTDLFNHQCAILQTVYWNGKGLVLTEAWLFNTKSRRTSHKYNEDLRPPPRPVGSWDDSYLIGFLVDQKTRRRVVSHRLDDLIFRDYFKLCWNWMYMHYL